MVDEILAQVAGDAAQAFQEVADARLEAGGRGEPRPGPPPRELGHP